MPKPYLLECLECLNCGGDLLFSDELEQYTCKSCPQVIKSENRVPLFTQPPIGMVPSERTERGVDIGTPWRKANWRFLEDQVVKLDSQAIILDVGAGRGDFSAAFVGRPYLALDVYPYPEVDIVCDLTQVNPFRRDTIECSGHRQPVQSKRRAPTVARTGQPCPL